MRRLVVGLSVLAGCGGDPAPLEGAAAHSLPREHWPCSIRRELHGPGTIHVHFHYEPGRERCTLPVALQARGLVGCPVQATPDLGPAVDFEYDAAGRLIRTSLSGDDLTFRWRGDQLLDVRDARGRRRHGTLEVDAGRLLRASERPIDGVELVDVLTWEGPRLVEIRTSVVMDSGTLFEELYPSYDCAP